MTLILLILGLAVVAIVIGSKALLVGLLALTLLLHWHARRALRSVLRARILAALSRGESYAVPLAEEVGLGAPAVYVMLRELEADGFLTSRMTTETFPERGNRPRRMFALASPGAAQP